MSESEHPFSDSQAELLDVVDAQDNVTGVETRGEIHRLKLRHRASHILVFNSQGQLFIQKRSLTKDNSPGLWDSSAAGHVDSGESYLACAVRELREELGLDISASELQYEFKLEASELTSMEFATVYTAYSDASLTLDETEIAEGYWVAADDVATWIRDRPAELTCVFVEIWQRLNTE